MNISRMLNRLIKIITFGSLMIIVLIANISSIAMAGMPYTFSPGTTAKSSEVNANFQHVNYGNIVVKSNGVEIGTFLTMHGTQIISVLNAKGYILSIEASSGKLYYGGGDQLYHLTADCTGTAYTNILLPGSVFLMYGGNSIYYIDKTATGINTHFNSVSDYDYPDGIVCVSHGGDSLLYPAMPNNPTVTGVSSSSYALPLTIERR